MTKYEILEKETLGVFDEKEASVTGIDKAMDEYAKQEAVNFFKWNASKVSDLLDYLKRVHKAEGNTEKEAELNRFESSTVSDRYDLYKKLNVDAI